MEIFKELVIVNKASKSLEAAITILRTEFEQSIMEQTEGLSALKEKETELRLGAMEVLSKNDEASVEIDNTVITKQTRRTIKIEDAGELIMSIADSNDKLKELGIDVQALGNNFKTEVVLDAGGKKDVLSALEKYENVEGKLLAGAIEQKTEFLIIKDK